MPLPLTTPWYREMTRHHWWVVIVATLGWLFDGMDQRLFVLARTPALRDLLPGLSEVEITAHAGYVTMIFIFGWATGGLIFGMLGDRIGRVRTMMLTILLYAAFTGLSAFARGWWDFAFFRFLCGIGIGGEYAAGVALVAEVVPARARPYCLGLLQGLGALGHLIASWISIYLGPQSDFHGVAGWRVLFVLGILPAVLAVLVRLRLRESDSWLVARDNARKAAVARRAGSVDWVQGQLGDFTAIFRDRRLRFHLLIGMLLGLAGQTGLWGIGYWTPELIRNAQLELVRDQVVAQKSVAAPEIARIQSLNLNQLALATVGDESGAKVMASQWRMESDRLVGRGTLLQDIAGMFGIYAFTFFTARVGRRPAFILAYLLALGATTWTFGRLSKPGDVYWMLPMLGFCVSSIYGGFAIYFPELFPTRLRSTGIGFCYNVARYITALGPLTLGKLAVLYAGMGFAVPLRPAAITLSSIFLVGVVTVFFAPETKDKPLPE